jgi:methylmalonic aciduria homocystinuria type C protein
MSGVDWRTATETVAARLRAAGLDLCAAIAARWYDEAVEPELQLGAPRPDALVVVVGNTRALWPAFSSALRTEPALADERSPLDTYVARELRAAASLLPLPSIVRLSHEPPPRRIAMQRMAEIAGLAPRGPGYLSIHPTFGPWIGLRGAIVLDLPGPDGEARPAVRPTGPWEAACEQAVLDALALSGAVLGHEAIRDSWRAWVAVRDACPIGREHRYCDEQLRYHYTHDRAILHAITRS